MEKWLKLKKLVAVLGGAHHQDYDHTKAYTEFIQNIAVADDDAKKKLIKRYERRESQADYAQKIELSNLTTPAIYNNILVPFNRALRMDNVQITWGKDEQDYESKFYAEKSAYLYLTGVAFVHSYYDPNAFLVMTIPPFDHNLEKATPVPVILGSDKCMDYEFKDGVLQYFVGDFGDSFRIYSRATRRENVSDWYKEGNTLRAELLKADDNATPIDTPVDEDGWEKLADTISPSTVVVINVGGKRYQITEHEPKIDGIQVRRLGYIPSIKTKGRTCVSIVDPALPRIKGLIKSMSEKDLATALHVFPQKIVQANPCAGAQYEGKFHKCKEGILVNTKDVMCPTCKGSGKQPMHTDSQDVIMVEMGKHVEDTHRLDNIVHYVKTDIETPKYLNDYIIQHSELCIRDIFPGKKDSQQEPSVKTATQVAIDYEDENAVLIPFLRNLEEVYRFCIHTGMQIKDTPLNKVNFSIRTSDDPIIQTLDELILAFKNSEGAPASVRKKLREKIARKVSSNSKEVDKREAIRIMYEPFIDKTPAQIQYGISQNLLPMRKRVLWMNFDDIMTELEANDGWVDFAPEKQKELINAQVDLLMGEIAAEIPVDEEEEMIDG
jgi:hypothetical protein